MYGHACMHAWQQHCSSIQRSVRTAVVVEGRARQADAQGKAIQANARRQLCARSIDDHHDRERHISLCALFFLYPCGIRPKQAELQIDPSKRMCRSEYGRNARPARTLAYTTEPG